MTTPNSDPTPNLRGRTVEEYKLSRGLSMFTSFGTDLVMRNNIRYMHINTSPDMFGLYALSDTFDGPRVIGGHRASDMLLLVRAIPSQSTLQNGCVTARLMDKHYNPASTTPSLTEAATSKEDESVVFNLFNGQEMVVPNYLSSYLKEIVIDSLVEMAQED